jgi:hypothetical protein
MVSHSHRHIRGKVISIQFQTARCRVPGHNERGTPFAQIQQGREPSGGEASPVPASAATVYNAVGVIYNEHPSAIGCMPKIAGTP